MKMRRTSLLPATLEAILTEDFKKLVVPICLGLGLKVVTDRDDEKLSDYLKRIQTGGSSVVLEFHFDAGGFQVPRVKSTLS